MLEGEDSASFTSTRLMLLFDADLCSDSRLKLEAREDDRTFSWDLLVGVLTYVAWLEVLDFELTLEASRTCGEPVLDGPDVLEAGPGVSLSTSSSLAASVAPFLCPETSVSGGVGGRDVFLVDDLRGISADFDRRASSPPTSVVSGVRGFDLREARSSLLRTASLLWALLNEGYGMEMRVLPSEVREALTARSLVEEARSRGSSGSFGRLRCFLVEECDSSL
jgi:hypothetical protein